MNVRILTGQQCHKEIKRQYKMSSLIYSDEVFYYGRIQFFNLHWRVTVLYIEGCKQETMNF
jgi:hypothetical protein